MKKNLRIAMVFGAALGAAACSSNGSAPTSFGVNIEVDATDIPPGMRKNITTDKLTVKSSMAGATPLTHVLADLPQAIQGGMVRFHYTPASGVTKDDQLTIGLDVMGAQGLIGSGSVGPFPLAANAVEAKIKLEPVNTDGGVTDGSGDGGGGDVVNPGGKSIGVACVSDGECAMGFCTDGVCCNERCDDVCASCSLSGSKGTCSPYAADTDPENECQAKNPMVPTAMDAGSEAGVAEAGAETGAEAGAEAGPSSDGGGSPATDGATSDAFMINPPDGGVMNDYRLCGGKCDGTKRACKFPDKTMSCGKSFCNSPTDVVSFACDGMGSCALGVSQCSSYACGDTTGSCRTTCSDSSHCLPGFYCDGNSHMCVDQKGNGLTCTLATECKSGNCSGNVCCNTACDGQGLTCTEAGHIGSCQCQGVTCAAGVACQVFYQDADSDGYGNMNGTIAAGTAKAGCMGSTPPSGFVVDHTDCDDSDANAHPTQTAFFAVQRKSGGFDYDCDNKITKETPEYPGGVCHYCGPLGSCETGSSATCADTSTTASFQCPQEYSGIRALSESVASPALTSITPSAAAAAAPSAGGPIISYAAAPAAIGPVIPPICYVCALQCCGCAAADKAGFRQAVACGDASVPMYTCGTCATAPGGAPSMTASGKQQRCR
jgi:hypothetical protein